MRSLKGDNREKLKSQRWKESACLRMASPVTVRVKKSQILQSLFARVITNSASKCKGKSGDLNKEWG